MKSCFLLLLCFLSLAGFCADNEKSYADLIYEVYALDGAHYKFPDSTVFLARKSLDTSLEKMFTDYVNELHSEYEMRKAYPQISALISWDDVKTKKYTFASFRKKIAGYLQSAYAKEDGDRPDESVDAFEFELVIWIGNFLKSTASYSEILLQRYNTPANVNVKPINPKEESFHTLFAGRNGNPVQRKYYCETYSKAVVLLSAMFELDPAVVSVISVLQDKNGKNIQKTFQEKGESKVVGHVCNLITRYNGPRVYYDQGHVLPANEEYALVEAFAPNGKTYKLHRSTDKQWYSPPFLIGQTVIDMYQIIELDKFLTRIENYIEVSLQQKYTDPKQTEQQKASYSEILGEMDKAGFDKLRLLSVDIILQKEKSIRYELNYQVNQLNLISYQLKSNQKGQEIAREYKNAVDTYNSYVEKYRTLTIKNSKNVPALKTAMKSLKKECQAKITQYKNDKAFMQKTFESDSHKTVHLSEVVQLYEKLIADIDNILNLPSNITQLNIK